MILKKEDLENYIKEHPEDTQMEIAVFFGTSVAKINKMISEYRLDYIPKTGKKTKIEGETIRKYLEENPNATINEMAMVFKVNDATIKRYLRISELETGKRLYRPSAILKQEIIDYININPRASKVQMATDLQLSLSVLNLQLNKFGIEWSEKEKRYVNKNDKESKITSISIEEKDDEDSDFFYRKVKSEEVENYKKSHPNATIRQIAAFFGTTEEKMKNFIIKHNIDLKKIEQESYETYKKQQISREKFVDKVIELLNSNQSATIEKIQQKISKKYGQNLPIRRLLEKRRVELIKNGNKKDAEKIKGFLLREIDDRRVVEEIAEEITRNNENENETERD